MTRQSSRVARSPPSVVILDERLRAGDAGRRGQGHERGGGDGTLPAARHSAALPASPGAHPPARSDAIPPAQRPASRAVLVVGSGASGARYFADDLRRAGRTVYLSVSSHRRMPRRFWGRDILWWMERLGRFALTVDDLPGGRHPPGLLVTGVDGGYDLTMYGLAADGVVLAGHLTGVTEDGRPSRTMSRRRFARPTRPISACSRRPAWRSAIDADLASGGPTTDR